MSNHSGKPVFDVGGNSIKMSDRTTLFRHLVGACLLIFLTSLSACGHEKKTKTTTVAVDTTVVDDDTLEVDDVPKVKQTEHAR
jgi:hypothetical protein